MKVIILGGGPAGLGAAYRLSKLGINAEVIEKAPIVGGLVSSYKIKNYDIERFYHIVYTTDDIFLELLRELNLYDKLKWNESKVGFFYNRRLYKMSTPLDLLRFKPLKFLNRIRFGLMTLKISYFQKDTEKLEELNAEEWLKDQWGDEAYEKIFRYLLRIKFGMSMKRASAAFVCERIKARAITRSKGGKEILGYFRGGYQSILNSIKEASRRSVQYHMNSEIKNIKKIGEKFIVEFESNGRKKKIEGDYVINTLPINLSLKLIKDFPIDYQDRLKKIDYQAVICVLVGLKIRLSDFYWINILSEDVPFGVMVEHTNLENEKHYGGDHIVYLGKYVEKNNEWWNKNDDEIIRLFLDSLKEMFPELEEEDILWKKISRNAFATPLYTIDFLKIMPNIESPIKGLYFAGNVMIYPNSRNVNYIIKSSYNAVDEILKKSKLLSKDKEKSN